MLQLWGKEGALKAAKPMAFPDWETTQRGLATSEVPFPDALLGTARALITFSSFKIRFQEDPAALLH